MVLPAIAAIRNHLINYHSIQSTNLLLTPCPYTYLTAFDGKHGDNINELIKQAGGQLNNYKGEAHATSEEE